MLHTPAARLAANILVTGRDGGHDLHLRTLRSRGVTLLGHFLGAEGKEARFARDLGESVAWGDDRRADVVALVTRHTTKHGLPQPEIPKPEPFAAEPIESVNLRGFGAVVFAGGFRPDYGSWIKVPGAFDDLGPRGWSEHGGRRPRRSLRGESRRNAVLLLGGPLT